MLIRETTSVMSDEDFEAEKLVSLPNLNNQTRVVMAVYGKANEQVLSSIPKLEMEAQGYISMKEQQPTPYHKAYFDGTWYIDLPDLKKIKQDNLTTDTTNLRNRLQRIYPDNKSYAIKFLEAKEYLSNPVNSEQLYPSLFSESNLRKMDMYSLSLLIIQKNNEVVSKFNKLETLRIETKIALESSTSAELVEQVDSIYVQRLRAFIDNDLQ